MGKAPGIRRDLRALEARRFAAIPLLRRGLSDAEIGTHLEVSNQTVSRWRRQYEAEGKIGLVRAERAGRKARLDASDEQRLTEMLQATRLKSARPAWTCGSVKRLIEREFGVSYHVSHVWKLLQRINATPG